MIFMEIKNVTNNVENKYPKMEQISKKHLSASIPHKWKKIGLSSLIISLFLKSTALAGSAPIPSDDMQVGGATPTSTSTINLLTISKCTILGITVSSIITLIIGLYIKKAKKQKEPKKVKTWVNILFILSLAFLIISVTIFLLSILILYLLSQ